MRPVSCFGVLLVASLSCLPRSAGALPAHDRATALAKLSPALAGLVETRPEETVAVWVTFADRAGSDRDPDAFAQARRRLSARSLERRARRGAAEMLSSDLPVHETYVRALVARGARLRGTSRWLNAASVEIPASLAVEIARLPFVTRVERVARGRRITPVGEPEQVPAGPRGGTRAEATAAASPGDTAYYGGAFRQLAMMQVPALHQLGLSGAGVLVCMLDTGYRLSHQAFAGLQVVATRDFINGDTNVDYDPMQDMPNQASHGTMTLACVAGSEPSTYSGGAFGAAVALAKTEDGAGETPVEMDYWQFAAEWADSLGADVISASLGYSVFQDTSDSYSYSEMDGRTTVVTLAAAEAARRGITVVTAAGNEGAQPWHHIIAPADADTVIAVGAVDSTNGVGGFSSRGPTADGRIKPDVSGMGVAALTVSPSSDFTYVRANGTSFATPLVAGVVALLLEAHPAWGPFEIREALRETALNHAAPNNDVGWGLVQGLDAHGWVPSTTGVGPGPVAAAGIELSIGPNPARAAQGAWVRFGVPSGSRASVEVLDLAGRRRARLFDGRAPVPQAVNWRGTDDRGSALPAGVYWIRVTAFGGATPSAAGSRATRVVLLD